MARRPRVSSEPQSRLSAKALPVTTLVAPSPTLQEVLVIPSTWLPVVSTLRFGITRPSPSGDSSGPRYLKTSRAVTLTLKVGELPLLCGLAIRATSLPLSATSVVRPSLFPS